MFKSLNPENYYDESTKVLSGPKLKRYYDRSCSIGRIAFEELRRRPNHICQICDSDNTSLTNEEVRLQAIRVARFFESLGLEQKDIVGFSGRNTTYAMSVPLACFFTGIACHAISPYNDSATAKKLLHLTKPKVFFCDGQDIEKIRFASSDFKMKIVTLSNHLDGVPTIVDILKPTGDEHKFEPAELESGPDQTLFLNCTSGSTGVPKLVTIPNSTQLYRSFGFLTSEDIQFIHTSVDWITGLMSFLICLVYGVTRVVSEEQFSEELFFKIIEKYKITLTFQLPARIAMIVKNPRRSLEKLDSVRYLNTAGTMSSTNLKYEMQQLLRNGQVVHSYGSSELNTFITMNCYSDGKPDAVGRLLPGFKVRIINANGENLGKNEVGEICCARPGYWGGYYNDPEATKEVFDENGWYYTGDWGYIDDDNYLYMVGRKKELLKYNAMKYYPQNIEEVIEEIPDVKGVCVFGIEDDIVGDKAAAVVVKTEGSAMSEQDIIDYVRKQIDAEHKQLHAGCKFFNQIPKTPNDKVDRKAAKELFLKSCA